MNSARRRCFALVAASGLVAAWGCRGGKPPVETSMTEVTVSGTVTKRGEPVSGGTVIFDPSNYRRKDVPPRSTPIESDGTYSITTLIGSNLVEVHGAGSDTAPISGFDFEAERGENTFDIELR